MDHDHLLNAFEAAWDARKRPGFEPACAPDVHYEDPLTDAPLTGARALARHAGRLWRGFPDARVESTGPRLRDGDHVAAPFRVLGTHRGEVSGLAATQRFAIVHGIFYCELRDDQLFRIRAFFDVYDVAVQLGVLPRPGSAAERALLMLRGFGLTGR